MDIGRIFQHHPHLRRKKWGSEMLGPRQQQVSPPHRQPQLN
jgi:hypothetical protein